MDIVLAKGRGFPVCVRYDSVHSTPEAALVLIMKSQNAFVFVEDKEFQELEALGDHGPSNLLLLVLTMNDINPITET